MKKRISVLLVCLGLVACLTACNLAEMEFGGLVGELLGGNEGIEPGGVPVEPDVNYGTAIDETWIEDDWVSPDVETVTQGPIETLNPHEFYGYELVILGQNTQDLGMEHMGDVFETMAFERNDMLQERFGITVTTVMVERATLPTHVKQDVNAGVGEYTLVYAEMVQAAPELGQGGYLISLYDLPYVDLYSSAWDQSMHRELTVGNYLPMATGEVTPDAIKNTAAILFNTEIATDLGLDMYDYVQTGGWTLEKMYSISKEAVVDLNADGRITLQDDRVGFVGDFNGAQAFAVGTQAQIVIKSAENLPLLDASAIEHMQSIYAVFYSLATSTGSYYMTQRDYMQTMTQIESYFINGEVLFCGSDLQGVDEVRMTELQYGILPYPKQSEQQTDYRSYINAQATAVMVPGSISDFGFAGYSLEAMAQLMCDNSSTLHYRIAFSPQDVEMLNVIAQTRTPDFASNYFYTELPAAQSFMRAMEDSGDSVTTVLRSGSKSLEKQIAKLIENAAR